MAGLGIVQLSASLGCRWYLNILQLKVVCHWICQHANASTYQLRYTSMSTAGPPSMSTRNCTNQTSIGIRISVDHWSSCCDQRCIHVFTTCSNNPHITTIISGSTWPPTSTHTNIHHTALSQIRIISAICQSATWVTHAHAIMQRKFKVQVFWTVTIKHLYPISESRLD